MSFITTELPCKRTRVSRLVKLVCCCYLSSLSFSAISEEFDDEDEFGDISLEDLLNTKIEAATKTSISLLEVPQSITVISRAEIESVPANSLAEVLEYFTGTNVVGVHSSQKVLSIRGSNAFSPAKILILIDGQKIDPTIFSTTWTELVPISLVNIERIELIRSPGTIYGSNAQNGVVNIITRNATEEDSSSGQIAFTGGEQNLKQVAFAYRKYTEDKASIHLSLELTEQNAYEDTEILEIVPGKPISHGEQSFDDGNNAMDLGKIFGSYQKEIGNGNFRAVGGYTNVKNITGRVPDRLCFIGLDGSIGYLNTSYSFKKGDNSHQFNFALNRNNYAFLKNSDSTALDRAEFTQTNYELSYELQRPFGEAHNFLFGLGINFENGDDGGGVSMLDQLTIDNEQIASMHFQDEWIITDKDRLYLGGLVSNHYVSGTNFAPLVSYVHKFTDDNVVRFGAFGSNRDPNIFEASLDYDQSTGTGSKVTRLASNRNLNAEKTITYEIGTRNKITPRLFVDATIYYSKVKDAIEWDLIGNVVDDNNGNLRPIYQSKNNLDQTIKGAEVEVKWSIADHWTSGLSYAYTDIKNTSTDADYQNFNGLGEGRFGEQYVPGQILKADLTFSLHRFKARMFVQRVSDHKWQWPSWKSDTGLDKLSEKPVPAYTTVDFHIAYQATDSINLSFQGRNVFNNKHTEWRGDKSYFGRQMWARAEYRW